MHVTNPIKKMKNVVQPMNSIEIRNSQLVELLFTQLTFFKLKFIGVMMVSKFT